MKKRLLVLLTLAIAPAFINAEEDSTTQKLLKAKMLKEADDDSLIKKSAQLKAVDNVLKDEEDSTLMKASKLKMLEEASKKNK